MPLHLLSGEVVAVSSDLSVLQSTKALIGGNKKETLLFACIFTHPTKLVSANNLKACDFTREEGRRDKRGMKEAKKRCRENREKRSLKDSETIRL